MLEAKIALCVWDLVLRAGGASMWSLLLSSAYSSLAILFGSPASPDSTINSGGWKATSPSLGAVVSAVASVVVPLVPSLGERTLIGVRVS